MVRGVRHAQSAAPARSSATQQQQAPGALLGPIDHLSPAAVSHVRTVIYE
jgi:hypothetical protein